MVKFEYNTVGTLLNLEEIFLLYLVPLNFWEAIIQFHLFFSYKILVNCYALEF